MWKKKNFVWSISVGKTTIVMDHVRMCLDLFLLSVKIVSSTNFPTKYLVCEDCRARGVDQCGIHVKATPEVNLA